MLLIFNALTNKKEKFKPYSKVVKMYSCGPTVYNYPHVGNYRAYITADILKRVLKYNNYKVKHVMNITDVDDKTIKSSQEQNKTLKEFTSFYIQEFFKDLKKLNIQKANKYPQATENISEMIKIINKLIKEGYAYKAEDGVYFNILKFKDYGKLSKVDLSNLKAGASGRVRNDEYQKENVHDFALWKFYEEKDGDVFWEAPFGKGRPGWHIECSAMSIKYLGPQFDIHTGGIDLIFPHHENEIAQSESYTGKKPFVKYWVYNEWLLVDGKKMSKSFGNFYTLNDLVNHHFSPLSFRYFLLQTHYRKTINFTFDSLKNAQKTLEKLKNFISSIKKKGKINLKYKNEFLNRVNDDLNIPKALSLIWKLIKDKKILTEDKKATLLDFDKILGLDLNNPPFPPEEIPKKVMELIIEREEARKKKDFQTADEIREKVKKLGYFIQDTLEGPKAFKIKDNEIK